MLPPSLASNFLLPEGDPTLAPAQWIHWQGTGQAAGMVKADFCSRDPCACVSIRPKTVHTTAAVRGHISVDISPQPHLLPATGNVSRSQREQSRSDARRAQGRRSGHSRSHVAPLAGLSFPPYPHPRGCAASATTPTPCPPTAPTHLH